MALLSYDDPSPRQPFLGREPLRVRADFGRVLFALVANQGKRSLRVQDEVYGAKPYTLPWNGSGTAPTLGSNRFGRCLRFAGTGASGVDGWGGYAAGYPSFIPAGTVNRATMIFVGRALPTYANNSRALYTASGGSNRTDFGLIIQNATSLKHSWQEAQYGSELGFEFTSLTAGDLWATAVAWRGGTSFSGWINGRSSGSVVGSPSTYIQAISDNAAAGSAASYTLGIEVNLCLVSDRAIPVSLAQDISFDPWVAFLPERKRFFFTPVAGGDSTPPSWGGSTVAASNVAQTTVTLTWGAATDNIAVTQYRYQFNSGGWNTVGAVLTVNATGLLGSTFYTAEVQAGDAAGNWSTSISTTFTTASGSDVTPPAWPVGAAISASSITQTSATLSWTAATDATGVTQYRYRLNGGSWVTQGNTTSVNLSSLTQNTTYAIDVQAGDAANNWSATLATNFTTLSSGVSLFPNALDTYLAPLLTYHAAGTSGLFTEVADLGLSLTGDWSGSMTYENLSGTAVLYLHLNNAGGEAAVTISGATNATPIVITTSAAHGYVTGDEVLITGVGGNTTANGRFKVTTTSTTQFSLQTLAGVDVAGGGTYTSGGSASRWVWVEYPAGNVRTVARYARLRIVTSGTLVVTSLGNVLCSVVARSEPIPATGGTVSTNASGPKLITLTNQYNRAKAISGTLVTTNAYHWVVDQVEVSGGRGLGTGTVMRFDGSGDYVSMGDQAGHTMSTGSADADFTLEAWARFDDLNTSMVIVGKSQDGVYGEYYMYMASGGQFVGSVVDDGVGYIKWYALSAIEPLTWVHLAFAYTASTKTGALYIDGQVVPSVKQTTGSYTRMRDTGYDFQVGRQGVGNYTAGCVDEVRLWGAVRTPAEIAANFDAEVSSSTAGLIGYWKFDEASGAALDSTASARHGTLYGNSVRRPYNGFDLYAFDASGTQVVADWFGKFEGV